MSIKILANDGLAQDAVDQLTAAGYEVDTKNQSENELENNIHNYQALLVRSATKVRKALIDKATNLKVIGRAGVGLDNIDVDYAKSKGIEVINTPAASSISVAELVFGHILSGNRFLSMTNRVMPNEGDTKFKQLKKDSSKGTELFGKSLGIIGFGRIGREAARIGIGMGMNILAFDPFVQEAEIVLKLHPALNIEDPKVSIKTVSKEDVLKNSDFITMHVPGGQEYVIGAKELEMMKEGSALINCSRGGTLDEKALKIALDNKHLSFAALDVFEQEPPVYTDILKINNISLSPHIGASTQEAQKRTGLELAEQLIDIFK